MRLNTRIRAGLLGPALVVVTLSAVTPAAAKDGWQTSADVGAAGLIVVALGKSVAEQDGRGAEQLGLSLGATAASTALMKRTFPEMRPNGRDDRSFPSGHTSVSFAAAGYLHQRYGWRWGLPAALAATVVGVSRVESKDHHWGDVVAGAALGEAAAFLITSPRDANVRISPWAARSGAGLSLTAQF